MPRADRSCGFWESRQRWRSSASTPYYCGRPWVCRCGAMASAHRGSLKRGLDVRRALMLEYLTVAWMSVEAVVAIGSGIVARSVSLTAFGLDSLVELASAGALIWRL